MTVFADELYPNGCSCGVDYLGISMTYKEHLIKSHVVRSNDKA